MNAVLIACALALLAAWPLAAVGGLVGGLAERLTRSPRLRETVWACVLALPLFVLVVMAIAAAQTPARVHSGNLVLRGLAQGGGAATHALNAVAPPVLESLLGRPQAVWIAGAVVALSLAGLVARMVLWGLRRRRLDGVVARAEPVSSAGLTAEIARQAARLGLAPPPVLVTEEIDQPLLVGLRRPVILAPVEAIRRFDDQRLALIGAHELAHLRRGDNRRLPLEEALLGLFWLTPLLGLARARMAAATEEACDRLALSDADEGVRKLYAQTLIDTLRLGAGPELTPAFIGAGRRSRLMRMNAILNPARPAGPLALTALGGLGAILVAAAGLAGQGAAAQVAVAQPAPAADKPAEATIILEQPTAAANDKPGADRPADGARTLTVTSADKPGVYRLTDGSQTFTVTGLDKGVAYRLTEQKPGVYRVAPEAGSHGPHGKDGPRVLTVDATVTGGPPGAYTLSVVGDVAQTATAGDHSDGGEPSPDGHSVTRLAPSGGGSATVTGDRVSFDKAHSLSIYTGSPQIVVVPGHGTDAKAIAYLINGEAPPAGFDPNGLDPHKIDHIEIHSGVAPGTVIDIEMKKPAG